MPKGQWKRIQQFSMAKKFTVYRWAPYPSRSPYYNVPCGYYLLSATVVTAPIKSGDGGFGYKLVS